MATPSRITLGAFEKVDFPEFGLNDITAKIDTGAYSGALHCTQIEEVETAEGPTLTFSPFDHPEITYSTSDYAVKHVKSSNGDEQARYFISTTIKLRGKVYPIALTLADRSEMKWPVLIGRRFLRQNEFLIDVTRKS